LETAKEGTPSGVPSFIPALRSARKNNAGDFTARNAYNPRKQAGANPPSAIHKKRRHGQPERKNNGA
jgi:hypothetical protein